mgnify:CR=1 FL=1
MAGALKKTMVYLGFAEDDRYDDYYDSESYDDGEAAHQRQPGEGQPQAAIGRGWLPVRRGRDEIFAGRRRERCREADAQRADCPVMHPRGERSMRVPLRVEMSCVLATRRVRGAQPLIATSPLPAEGTTRPKTMRVRLDLT